MNDAKRMLNIHSTRTAVFFIILYRKTYFPVQIDSLKHCLSYSTKYSTEGNNTDGRENKNNITFIKNLKKKTVKKTIDDDMTLQQSKDDYIQPSTTSAFISNIRY